MSDLRLVINSLYGTGRTGYALSWRLGVTVLMAGVFCGCSLLKQSGTLSQPEIADVELLNYVDTDEPEKFIDRFYLAGFSLGSWLDPYENGSLFKPMRRLHPDSAMVYIYRPDSSWSRAEVLPASIFINGKRLHSLKNNHYYSIELPAGSYRMTVSRPLGFVYFQKGTVINFKVEEGKDYYLKYAEQHYVSPPDPSLGLLYAKPIMQMPTQAALKEIAVTRAKTTGYTFLANPNALPDLSLPGVGSGDSSMVDAKHDLSESQEAKPGVAFKIYNPLTW